MNKIIFLILVLAAPASAGMIEYTDDDPVQYLCFDPDSGLCDTITTDSIQAFVQIDPDSGYAPTSVILGDTLSSLSFKYISPDRDSLDRVIPGHYVGEYWYYTISFFNNQGILSADTVHQSVDYWKFGGCLPIHEID